MTRLLNAVARALSPRPADTNVHFHQGAAGTPAACFDARCDRPQLDIA